MFITNLLDLHYPHNLRTANVLLFIYPTIVINIFPTFFFFTIKVSAFLELFCAVFINLFSINYNIKYDFRFG